MLTGLLRDVEAAVVDPADDVARVLRGQGKTVHVGRIWPGRAVYLLFAPGARTPTVVLKADLQGRHKKRLRAEHRNLRAVGTASELAGSVPESLALVKSGPRLVLAQTGLQGTALNSVLRRRLFQGGRSTAQDFEHMVNWLRRFHSASEPATPVALEPEMIRGRLARTLPGEPADWTRLLARVERAGQDYAGLQIPRVWCHGDLGPSNCLISNSAMSVIDWEGGPVVSNPLVDLTLFLSLYSRAMPGRGFTKPVPEVAFERAFTGNNWLARITRSTFAGELEIHGLPSQAAPYLLLDTLANLAAGTAGTAHSRSPGFQRAYQYRLGVYAKYIETTASL